MKSLEPGLLGGCDGSRGDFLTCPASLGLAGASVPTIRQAADIALSVHGSPVKWHAVARDGTDLPKGLRREGNAEFISNTGQIFDLMSTPIEPGNAILSVTH
jgi:hypothetical protein